ncbi:efflux RND transporter permease subunit [Hymenobacter convexus]|uniref:efflux RND transporter permease subunit n=1 Tax=Hymenobacter sp. CA1UV-4 TaxID=3063782 RepID=UPI0027137A45|nr:MMPL family transporter [Hymenobacter sp. CA1UV-4]MDO7854073.1 MMPL family transporter [Hymenobacter sp. CA1UV-4]
MWKTLAIYILRYRLLLVSVLLLLTGFLGWHAKDAEITYNLDNVVSPQDPDLRYFQQFRHTFGEDGNVLVIGLDDARAYQLAGFTALRDFSRALTRVPGVLGVVALPTLRGLQKDAWRKKLTVRPLFAPFPTTQHRLDSLLQVVRLQPLYQGQLLNTRTGATLLAVNLDPAFVNSARMQDVLQHITDQADRFQQQTGIHLHFAGLPYVRAVITAKVTHEMKAFLVWSVLIMAGALFAFFRSGTAVVFPLLVVLIVVVWTIGSLVLLGYKITLLTGLLPTIIVVVGIPNCTYLLARYHYDLRQSGNRVLAMTRVVGKIGLVTLMNNTTTAIGFFVFCFTDIAILYQFGLVATLNIFVGFLVSFILIPVVFVLLPAPTPRQLAHLQARPLRRVLDAVEQLVLHHRRAVYAVTGGLLLTAAAGLSRVHAVAYMVDDIPQNSSVRADLQFFQRQFSGVMPLEIVVDTGRKGGVLSRQNLARIDQFEQYLATLPGLTPSVSVVTGLKAATQAFYNDAPGTFRLPDATEQGFVLRALAGAQPAGSSPSALLRTLVDSTGQQARLSLRMADVGSNRLDTLMNQQIAPAARRLFAGSRLQAHLTGTTLLFTKGTAYLIHTLKDSLLLAFGLVGLVVLLLFRSVRAVAFALLPNLVTLVLTGGLMGYLGIPLKPSTALIFSIALGIDGDNSIHLLAKFRQELAANGGWARRAIATTLREAGTSLLYTSVVLLLGFGIFAFSDFGGTQALGLLMGASLLITNFSNLVLLPCLLVTFTPVALPAPAPARVRIPGATALRVLVPARSRQ